MLTSKPARWVRSRLGATYHHTVLGRQPRVLSNSFPKSGTNLVIALIEALPLIRSHGRGVTWNHVPRALVDERARPTRESTIEQLQVCLPGEVFLGHVEADPVVMDFIERRGFRRLFVYRDPRDVVVSLLHWWQRDPSATWRESDTWPFRFFHSLDSNEERLIFLIEGWPASPGAGFPAGVDFPDIGERFAAFLPWVDDPSTCAFKFEELVDPGSGPAVVRRIARYLYPSAGERRLDGLVERMRRGFDPSRSKTFRKGSSGGWRDTFSAAHRQMFKDVAGELLVQLGYERDLEW